MTMLPPLPVLDPLTTPFWEGCHRHELLIQHCLACGSRRFPPGPVCLECRSDQAEWRPARGLATVFSWIVVRHPIPAEVYASEVPYVVALVDLEEGVRMVTNIIGCAPEAVTAGMRLEVVYKDVNETVTLPQFRPVGIPERA